MRRHGSWTLIVGVAVASAATIAKVGHGQDGGAPPGTTEPPLLLFAEHEGAEVPIELDRPATVGGATFTLRARAHRALEPGPFVVHYPRNYHFEHERGDFQDTWVLTGADAKLMVFVSRAPLEAEAWIAGYAGGLLERFQDATDEPVRLELEGVARTGRRLRMRVGGERLVQDAFALELPGGRALLLVVQDVPSEDGGASAEATALRALVTRTFRRKT